MRLQLLHAKDDESIRVEIFYPKPQRLDIYRKSKSQSAFYSTKGDESHFFIREISTHMALKLSKILPIFLGLAKAVSYFC